MEPEALNAFPLFLDLEPETRRALATSAVVRTIAAGDFLFREGEPARSVHVLLDGMVELSLAATRSGCSVMIFTGGDVFLPAAALFEEPYLASGRALSESRVLVMDADRLRELAKNDAGLAMELLRLVSGQCGWPCATYSTSSVEPLQSALVPSSFAWQIMLYPKRMRVFRFPSGTWPAGSE